MDEKSKELRALIQKDQSIVVEEQMTPESVAQDFFELDLQENAFQITFDPSGELAAGFADSKNVYYISIESVNHGD